jgi:hypothetical protein
MPLVPTPGPYGFTDEGDRHLMPRYDVQQNPDGSVTINGYTFPAGTAPDFRSSRSSRRADGLSAQQARTVRHHADVDAGRHPLMGGPLREPRDEMCGTCRHAVEHRYNRTFWKCNLMRANWTKGPGTDIRKSWPACHRWEAKDAPETIPEVVRDLPPQPDPLAPVLGVQPDPGLAPTLGG